MADDTGDREADASPSLLELVDPAALTRDTVPNVTQQLGNLKVDDSVAAMEQWWPALKDSVRAAFIQWRWERKDTTQRLRGCLLLASRIHSIDKDRAHSLLTFTYAKESRPGTRVKALRDMWLTRRPKRSGFALTDVDASAVPSPLASLLVDDLFTALDEFPAKADNDIVRKSVVEWIGRALPNLADATRPSAEAKLARLRPPLEGAPRGSVGAGEPQCTSVNVVSARDAAHTGRVEEGVRTQAIPNSLGPRQGNEQASSPGTEIAAVGTKRDAPSTVEDLLAQSRKAASSAAALLAQAETALSDRNTSLENTRRELTTERERLNQLLAQSERNAALTLSTFSDKLDQTRAAHDALRLQHNTIEAQLASTLTELEHTRTEVAGLRGALTKERELRLDAVAKERQDTQRRMREQLAHALHPEFAKLGGETESEGEAAAFALKLVGSIRQRLKAQGIEV